MIGLLHIFSKASTEKCPLILPLQKQYLEESALQCKGLLKNTVQVVPEWMEPWLTWSMATASFPPGLAAEQGWAASQDHQQYEQAISGLPGKRGQF